MNRAIPPSPLRSLPGRLLLAAVVVVGVACMPRDIYPGDPVTMREETRAILLRGELAVSDVVVRNYAATGEPGQYVVDNPRNGRSYSKYGSMAAWLYLIPMGLEKLVEGDLPPFGSQRQIVYLNVFNVVLSLLVAASLFRTAQRFGAAPWAAAAYVALCFYATFLWNYLRAQNSEIMQLLLCAWAVSAFLDVLDARRQGLGGGSSVVRLWLACAALLLTKVAYLLIGPLFAVGLMVDRKNRLGGSWLATFVAEAKVHLLPASIAVGVWLGVNTVKFGSPWRTGYHVWRPEIHGFTGDVFEALYHLLFTPQWGLGFCFPVLFLALPFIGRWCRQDPVRYGTLLGIGLTYLLLIGMLPSWRGEMCYGPRYWLFVLPFVSLPALDAIKSLASGTRPAWVALVLVGAGLMYSTALQWQVNRHSFFAFYALRGPFEQTAGLTAASYFLNHSYGRVLWDFSRAQDRLSDLPWWKEMKARLRPQDAEAYEKHVRAVLAGNNLFWFTQERSAR